MENLNLLVFEMLKKLKVVEEKKPVNNVTTNIMRIRELIAQARSVAKKVSKKAVTVCRMSTGKLRPGGAG